MVPDTHVRDDVQRELYYTPGLNAARIGVSVEDGVVTLTGTLGNHHLKLAAIHAAERVKNVRAVACRIEIPLPGPRMATDADLASAAANALAWNECVPPDRVRICLENGWITLEGTVDWQNQKHDAARAVGTVTGIRGVENLISVNPALDGRRVKEQIEFALRRSVSIEERNVLVEVNADKVILHGEVQSMLEREEAERIAWEAAGVSDVANHILIAQSVSNSR
jgi:osmotically-inducible protein OsmY